jgi:hypothetical protein
MLAINNSWQILSYSFLIATILAICSDQSKFTDLLDDNPDVIILQTRFCTWSDLLTGGFEKQDSVTNWLMF